MSIPLVQKAEKDDINTSIIAIKRNIERINMLLGLVDTGGSDPDLSGLATKQELQDAVESLQPVDEVTIDNMHSVTSNAVADSYVITEVYSYSTNKLVVVKPKNIDIYIFYFYGAKITDFGNAISNLGITTQKIQTGFVSRRDSGNNYVFPCTVVLNTNGTVGAWYASGGIEYTLGINDIIYGQMVICKN